jgi:solute:Na+ symporter, SSS family
VAVYAVSTDATIHHMVESAYRITLAGAFVPLVAGLFWKRANNLGATLAIVLGIGTWLMLELFVPEGDIEPQLYGLVVSALGMIIGGYLGAPAHHRPHAGHHHSASATHHTPHQ